MRTLALGLVSISLLSCRRGGSDDGAPGPVTLEELHPIDGQVDFGGLAPSSASLAFFDTTATFVKNTTLTYAITNDDRDLYVALEWTDDTLNNTYTFAGPVDFDGVVLLLDNDGDGTYETGEDKRFVIAGASSSQYLDQHANGGANEDDVCGDGFARMKYDAIGQKWRAEFLFPKTADAQGQDATITAATRFNIILYDNVVIASGTGNTAGLFAGTTSSAAWGTVPLASVAAIARPAIPTGLTGLIIFESEHEDPKGEIYTLDPATGTVTRITTNSFYEDCLSLSHDRQWIAFHGAANRTDYSSYEIYKVKVDGTGLVQLTSNAILDGHPAWSPDDSKIAYASFRDPGAASIVVMTSAGSEIADLTVAPTDDNDPEWLPDGRIVFKTNRFNALPKVKMGTMNADGTGVQQVTFDSVSPDTSDHDAVGDSTYCIFERFMKGTDYSADIDSFFTPWNIVEARLDGASERTVLADGWINWLPVYDPSGQYVVHLKSVGYTDLRLMTRAGGKLGRLVPNITRARYLDWK